MYNVAICDDEKAILDSLSKLLYEVAEEKVNNIYSFETVNDLIASIAKENPSQSINILFLDIEIGESNGIDVASHLLTLCPDLQIIFMSGHDDYYLDVYDVDHSYFLKKPITKETLSKALIRVGKKLNKTGNYIFYIKSHNSTTAIRLGDILYFEKDLRQILAHTDTEAYSFYGKFNDIMPQLNERFFRCHNSFVVNFSNAKCIETNAFTMKNGFKVPISRSRFADTKSAYIAYLERDL